MHSWILMVWLTFPDLSTTEEAAGPYPSAAACEQHKQARAQAEAERQKTCVRCFALMRCERWLEISIR